MSSRVRARLAQLTFAQTRVALLMIAVAATACLMPAQSDSYWHLRAGYDLARTGHVALVDTYSHTARGLAWPNHEWLWQALSFACHRLGGMPLLTAAGAALATAACAVAYGLMRARPSVNFVLALLGIPLASVVWALRPQVASLLLLVLLLRLLIDGRHLFIPPLFLLWANLHGAVALGGLVMMVATGVAWFHDRRLAARLAILTIVCGALTAATPMGVHLWTFIGESMARSRQNQIMEWMPSYPKGPVEISFWVAALILVGATIARWRKLDRWGDRLVVVTALVMVPLAARAVRNIAPFCLVWMPALSRLIGPAARLPGARPAKDAAAAEEHPRLNLMIVVVMLAGAALAMLVAWRLPLPRLGWQPIPAPAIAAIRRCGGPLYNRYNEGGYLIWFVPEVPVFIDSRQDPYPADVVAADIAVEKTGDYRALFPRYGIRCAALPPVSPVGKRLAADGWRELYRDETWVVQATP